MANSRIIPIQLMKGSKVVPLTPDEYARYQQSVWVSNAQTWILTLIAAFLFLTTFVVESKAAKSFTIFTGLAVAIAAKLSSGENVKADRIAKDYTDGSDSSRQGRFLKQMDVEQIPVESWYKAVEEEEDEETEYPHDLLCKPHTRDFVERFTLDRNSKLIVGAPGCGKTVTAKAWIAALLHYFPQALLLINYRKRASFCGLEQIPGACQQSKQGDLQSLFNQMRLLHSIHQKRSNMTPDERKNQMPAVLYIADYAATWGGIQAILRERGNKQQSEANLYLERLHEVITLGRENNIQVCIDTQSFNLAALGNLDSNSRGCLTALGLGFNSIDHWGQKSGNYEVLQLLLRNPFMVSSEGDREQFSTWLPLMRDYSKQTNQPLAFTTLDGPELFFLPDYRLFEDHILPESCLQTLTDTIQFVYNSEGQILPDETMFDVSGKFQTELKPSEMAEIFQDVSELSETLKPFQGEEFQDSFQVSETFTKHNLPAHQARSTIRLLISEGHTQTEIIKILWDANPGGSKAYLQAKDEYHFLMNSDEQ